MATHYCKKCGKTMDDKEFYTSKNLEKYPPNGKFDTCKKCLTMHVDNWNPDTYMWILEEADVPYVKEEWDKLLEKYGQDPKKISGVTILGRYLSKMKLKQWSDYTFADTQRIAEEQMMVKINQMKAQGMSGEEIEAELSMDRTPAKPVSMTSPQAPVGTAQYESIAAVDDEFEDQLTDEDKLVLRMKWGASYMASELVRLEQLYRDFERSYDIQGAGMVDTLIMICKASFRANQLIDTGDIEGFQKMSKVYNDLMKSAKLTNSQIKSEDSDEIDSIGELVALCEKEGFIPRYYVDTPKDHVDRTLQDMQSYTRTLVIGELNLGNMIEAAVKEIESDKAREQIMETDEENLDEEARFEATLFAEDKHEITFKDYMDFEDFKDEMRNIDQAGEADGAE